MIDDSDDGEEDDMCDASLENDVLPLVGFHFCFSEEHWENIFVKNCS